ncbi:MAG: hypothetical protein ABI921_00195 [Panacibacter sp.]
MIRITPTSLIIEIKSGNHTPLERLSDLQSGLIDILAALDITNAPPVLLQNGLRQLHELLSSMMLSGNQLAMINEGILEPSNIKEQFNIL